MKSRFLAIAVFLLASTHVWAQATAQIHGTIQDASGAGIPSATVKATQTDTGVSRTATTEADGGFVLPNLPLGPYKLDVEKEGFAAAVQTGVILQVGSDPAVNFALRLGTVSETVNVEANAALVETRGTAIGSVVENQRILELPLNGRNVIDLMVLTGASNVGNAGGLATGTANPFNRTGSVSIAGGVAVGVNFVLDGANHNNPSNSLEMPMPFPDALQEFKVETSALTAQYGLHSAGAVNAVTKAGTNSLHGDLFEFVRNYKFNARNFFAPTRDSLKRNQFGGTLGGPIIKNKLFFFGGFQGTYLRQDANANITFVPTAAMLAGDFRDFASADCNSTGAVTLKAPFVNNQIDPALFSKTAIAYAQKLTPAQNKCGRTVFGARGSENNWQYVAKVDYQLSTNHSIFGRYLATTILLPEPYNLSGVLLASNTGIDALAQTLTVGDTYLISSSIVNSFRFTMNRSYTARSEANCCSLASLGSKMYDYGQLSSIIAVSGGFTIGGNTQSNGKTNVDNFGFNDDISWVKGAHQLGFGVSASFAKMDYLGNSYDRGQLSFNGGTTGLGLADFLTGNVFSFIQGPANYQDGRQRTFGLYVQDTWKALPRLTVNLGLRWEPYLPLQRADGAVSHFDFASFMNGTRTSQFTKAPPGLFYPGDPGFPENSGTYRVWNNFSPRIGLAWDPMGDGKMSVRAAFGMFYDFQNMLYFNNTSLIPPWTPRIEVRNVSLDDPWKTYPGGNPFPLALSKDTPFPLATVYPNMRYDTKNPAVRSWNLSVQRQIGTQWVVSGTYLGNQSIHIWASQNVNPAVYIPGASTTANTEARRFLTLQNPTYGPYFAKMIYADDGGTASYEGLLLTAERRFNKNLSFNANYTWSHCISDPYMQNLAGAGGVQEYSDPNNRRADRGNCLQSATDRRHVFNLTGVARTPSFTNRSLRLVASNWSLSPIIRITSGDAYTVTTSTDVGLTAVLNQRVNQVADSVYGDGTILHYLNASAFKLPATGGRGNMGAANIQGPLYWQFDTSLARAFRIREGQQLEVRGEAFNLLNGVRKGPPIVNFNAGNFGQITTALDPRIMQFAFKYVF